MCYVVGGCNVTNHGKYGLSCIQKLWRDGVQVLLIPSSLVGILRVPLLHALAFVQKLFNPRRACAARVTVLGLCVCVFVCVCLCVCYSTSHFSYDYLCHKRYQPQWRMKVKKFKRFFLKMLHCEATAFPVGTAT